MPKFPDLLLNNNPNAPSIDLNDLQVKGVGIFADKAERDLLDPNIQTEGYLAIMKDDDNLYVYIGGGWSTATNWVRVSGTLQVAEVDGLPIGDVTLLAFPPSTLTITGSIATVNLSGYATVPQLSALQTEVDNIETALGIEITGVAPPTDPGDILISDGTNFGVSVYSLPTTDGSAGQFLQTDGLGNVSFATISATLEGLTDTPVGYGTAGQILVSNGTDAFTLESVGLWDTVVYTGQTAIKYENGVVGIKASGTAYSTNSQLLAKAGQFPINTGTYSTTSSGVDALMHLHEGRIIYTTDNSPTGATAMSLLGTTHTTTDYGSIGLYDRKLWLDGGEGVYLGAAGNRSVLAASSANTNVLKIGVQNWDARGGIQLDGDTGSPTNYMKIVMGGQIIFHGHTASKWVAISRRGTYGTDGGVQVGSYASGLFANFADSDGNTPGSFGYLGINANTPSASGPAFEVSSSYGRFNNGLSVVGTVGTNWYTGSITGKLRLTTSGTANGSIVITNNDPGGSNINYGVFIGASSVATGTGTANNSIVIGSNTAGGTGDYHESVIIGYNALAANTASTRTSVLIGYSAGSAGTNGFNVVGVGFRALMNATGSSNVGVGQRAGMAAGGSGTFVGNAAGEAAAGASNVGIGAGALVNATGDSNVAVGAGAGSTTTGAGNVMLGYQSGQNETGSNRLYIDNSNTTTPLIYGEFDNDILRVNGTFQINDPASTGYAFPTTTGTLGQILVVDANGDLTFGSASSTGSDITLDTTNFNNNLSAADTTVQLALDTLDNMLAGQWTADSNGINYQAGNVGIGAASTAGDKLSITGRLSVLGHVIQDANNDGNYNIVIGNANSSSALATNNCVVIGNNNTIGASNTTQTVVIGRNKDVSTRNYRCTDIGLNNGSTYIDAAGSASGQIAIQSSVGSHLSALSIGGAITGDYAIAIGGSSRSGTENVTVGNASYSSYGPSYSAVIGRQIARFHTGGGSNVLAGYRTVYGTNTTSVSESVFIGREAGYSSTTNARNIAIGYRSAYSITTGSDNTLLGYGAGYAITTASNNLLLGKNTGYNVVTDANIFIGEEAGYSQTGSGYKIFIGGSAGRTAAGGPGIAIGRFAAQNATVDDSESVVIGENATFTGIRSVTLGAGASAGANGVAVGRSSSVTQDNSIAIGSGASVTGTGATYTIAIGTAAQGLTRGIYIGGFAGQNATGSGNVQIGEQPTRMGASNTIVGHNAGAQTQNYATEVFDQNVVIGRSAAELAQGQTDNNVIIGHQAAYSADGPLTGNVIIGKSALSGSTTTAEASNNVIIGTEAAGTSIGSSNIFIGYQAAQSETGSNKLYIENSNSTTPLIYGEFDNDIVTLNAGVSITGSRTANLKTVGLDVTYGGALIGSSNNNGATNFPATWEFHTGVFNGANYGSTFWVRPGSNASGFNANYQSQIVNAGYSTHIITGLYTPLYLGQGADINAKTMRIDKTSVNAKVLKVGPVDAPNFSFPSVDGTANQVIVTDGAGQGSWATSYTQKYESVATAEVGNSTQTETGTVAFVERYYTAKKDGDAVASSSYTGAGTRRLFYAPKYNADPTKIENQDNPEGWILVNTGEQWTVDTYADIGFGGITPTTKHNLALDEETNTEANYISLLEQYIGHENYSDSAEVTFAVVVIPTVITINSGATGTYQFEFAGGSWGGELARIEDGTTIDWGDGNVDTVTGGAILTVTNCEAFANHTYASTDTDYTITINGFVRSTYFDTDQQLKAIKMGTQLRLNQGNTASAIADCHYLSSFLGRVFFLPTHTTSNTNMTAPTFKNCVRLNAVNMEHFFTPYQYPVWDGINSHNWVYPFKNVWSDYKPNCNLRTQQLQFAFQLESLGTSYAADFTNGSAAVTRSGGLDFKIVEGRRIYVDNTVYTIQSIDSTTQLTLTSNFTGTTGSYNMDFDFSQKPSFTSFSNIELLGDGAAFYGGSPLSDYDIETFKKYEGGPYMGYLNTYLGVTTAPAYPKPITKFFANDTTKYISPGFVNVNIASTTIHAPSGWNSDFTIPTRPTFSVDCVNNTKNITMTSGDTDYRIQEGFGVEIDGNIYLVSDHTGPNTFTIATNFTSATGTYTLTVLTCPPIIIDGYEHTVVSIDNVNNTAEIYPIPLVSGEYNIEFLGWRIGNGGGVRKYGFSFIKDPNPIIQNVDLSNVGTTAYTYQSATLFRSGKIVSPDLRGWTFPITPRSMRYTGNGGSGNQGLGYSFEELFYNSYNFNTNTLSEWDTKGVGDFHYTFANCYKFNGNICSWDMSGAWRLSSMFNNARKFNQDISGWDTSRVREMNSMFNNAYDFNQPIGKWDVGNVRSMNNMFQNASGFNQDLSTWDTKNVRGMSYMFSSSAGLNTVYNPFGDLSSWDVSNVTNFQKFADSTAGGFANSDWDLGQWDIGSATNITYMFQSGAKFRPEYLQGLSNWDFTNVGSLEATFRVVGDMHLVDVSNWQIQNANIQGAFQYTNNTSYTAANGETYKYCAPGIGFASWNNRLGNTVSLSSFMRFCASVDIYRYDMDVTNGSPTVTIQDPYIGATIATEITTANKDHWQLVIGGVTYFISAVSADFRTVTLTTNYTGSTSTEKVTFKWVHNPDISGWDVSTVESFGSAFESVYLDRDVSGWNLSACTNMSKAFTGLVDAQVAAALIGWNNNVNTPNGVTATLIFGGSRQLVSATYPGAEAAYLNLIDSVANGGKGWTITGLSFI